MPKQRFVLFDKKEKKIIESSHEFQLSINFNKWKKLIVTHNISENGTLEERTNELFRKLKETNYFTMHFIYKVYEVIQDRNSDYYYNMGFYFIDSKNVNKIMKDLKNGFKNGDLRNDSDKIDCFEDFVDYYLGLSKEEKKNLVLFVNDTDTYYFDNYMEICNKKAHKEMQKPEFINFLKTHKFDGDEEANYIFRTFMEKNNYLEEYLSKLISSKKKYKTEINFEELKNYQY